MAEIVMAYSASHAPMMTADPGSAPREQADSFFGALEKVRDVAKEKDVQAIVMMTGEHFTNFFLDGLPQIAIGLDDEHLGPPEVWLQVPKKMVPSDAGLAAHITAQLIEQGQQPGAVLRHEDRPRLHDGLLLARSTAMELPMVPIVLNCTTPPLMTMRQFYDFGVALGKAIRSYDGLERVGAGRRRRPVALRRRAAGRRHRRGVRPLVPGQLASGDLSPRSSTCRTTSWRGRQRHRRGPGLGRAGRGDGHGAGPRAVLRGRLRVDQRHGRRAVRRRPGHRAGLTSADPGRCRGTPGPGPAGLPTVCVFADVVLLCPAFFRWAHRVSVGRQLRAGQDAGTRLRAARTSAPDGRVEQPGGVLPQDAPGRFAVQPEPHHGLPRVAVGEFEGVVRTEQHVVRTDVLDQPAKQGR